MKLKNTKIALVIVSCVLLASCNTTTFRDSMNNRNAKNQEKPNETDVGNEPSDIPTSENQSKDKVISTTIDTPVETKLETATPEDQEKLVIKTQPKNGSVRIINEEIVEYTPNPGFHGPDSFTYGPDNGTDEENGTITVIVENKKLLIFDDFERATVIENQNFHWLQLIRDQGLLQDEKQECVNKICANIVKENSLPDQNNNLIGPTTGVGESALLFYGRHGSSIHNVYLISRDFNLTAFKTVTISFDYLMIDLGDDDTNNRDRDDEYLKVEVCIDGLAGCGISPINSDYLDDKTESHWKTIASDKESNQLNGRNHKESDWKHKIVQISLSEYEQLYSNFSASKFSFRFNTRLTDGFINDDLKQKMVDGVFIDNVKVEALGSD